MSQTILITGASSGIGAETAKYLSEQGYTLVLTARSEDRLNTIAQSLSSPCHIFPYDLNDLDHIETIFEYCKEQNLKLDGMVHCAGITIGLPVRSISYDELESVMRINYYAFVELAKSFSKRAYSNNNGSIVAMSSISAYTCWSGTGCYSGTKAAMNAMVRVMSREFSNRSIRVNAIAPAVVETPMGDSVKEFKVIDESQPMGGIEPRQISYMIEYLLSEKAKYISGAIIPISAGLYYEMG